MNTKTKEMEKTNNICAERTNNTNTMDNTTKFHITLRENGKLIDWRGYTELSDALPKFFELIKELNTITDGDFEQDTKALYPTFTNGMGCEIALVPTTEKLLMQILFGNNRTMYEIFSNFFEKEKSLA